LSNYIVNSDDLGTVADAIRQKSGSSAAMTFPEGFASQIQSIPTGSGGDSDVFWVDVQLDLQTMTATVDSGAYAAVQAAIEAGKLVVGRSQCYISATQKQLVYMLMDGSFDPDIGYVLFSANMRANFGSGTHVYYFRFILNSDDTINIEIELVNTTTIQ